MDDMFTMLPAAWRRMGPDTVRMPRWTPCTLTSMTRRCSSNGTSSIAPTMPIPALFTRMSTRPHRATVAPTVSAHSPGLVTSSSANAASAPSSSTIAATFVVANVGDDDAGALGEEPTHLRLPETADSTADDRNLALDPSGHPSVPSPRRRSPHRC